MVVKELKKALEFVKPGIANKELIEQSTHVVFRGGFARTFNDEVAVMAPIDLTITGAVPADPLYAFLNRLKPEDELKIEEGENELKLSSGRKRASIRMSEQIKLPLDEEIGEPDEWYDIPETFLESLSQVLFSASKAGHIPILTCVHITDEFLETCDEFRMTRTDCKGIGDSLLHTDILIVAQHVEKLALYTPKEFGFTKNWIHFRSDVGVEYCVRSIDAKYPDLDAFIEVEGVEIELPKDLDTAVDWASVVVDDKLKLDQVVSVVIGRGKMVIKGRGSNGIAEEEIRMKYSGNPVEFEAHPSMLKDIAKRSPKVTVGDKALKIESPGFVHVVSLNPKDE